MFTSTFCGEALAIFDRFDHHSEKKHCTLGYVDFHQNFNGRRFSIPRTISAFGIAMRSLKLADLWHFENHCSHFCVTNPSKFRKGRAQTDNLKSINLPQLFSRQISTSLLQSTPSFTSKSLPCLCAFFDKLCPNPSPNSCNDYKSVGVETGNVNQNFGKL